MADESHGKEADASEREKVQAEEPTEVTACKELGQEE